ncbi:MAG: hypothetical protein ACSHYA_10810 [Opitutaceae bacterium]
MILTALAVSQCRHELTVYSSGDEKWLPEGASEGCRYNLGLFSPFYFIEYDISEANFMKEFLDREFKEIESPFYAKRYLSRLTRQEDFGRTDEGYEKFKDATHARITNGLYYYTENGDRTTSISFDRSKGRAYVYHTTR